MNIEGTYTLQATGEEVWRHLMEQEVLRTTIPGLESIEQIDQGVYAIALTINYASLKDSYRGRLLFSEQHYPYHYRLSLEREEGTFNGSGSVNLSAHGDTTVVAYKGTLATSKSGIQLPQSMVKGAVKLFIQQYFLALAEHIQSEQHLQSMTGKEAGDSGFIQQGNTLTLTAETGRRQEEQPATTIYRRIVTLLHVGGDDPAQAAIWEQRLRRASIASGLLFLVWLGTRLPRRRSPRD